MVQCMLPALTLAVGDNDMDGAVGGAGKGGVISISGAGLAGSRRAAADVGVECASCA